MSAQPPVPIERVVILADGQPWCVPCADAYYRTSCPECGRAPLSGVNAIGATHKGCGGVFRARDTQHDLVGRRVLRADDKPVECAMCAALIGGA